MSSDDDKELIFSDRYDALGIKPPKPGECCPGLCEGTGYVPIKSDESRPRFRRLWEIAEAKEHAADGWHFVVCPDCNGKGTRDGI